MDAVYIATPHLTHYEYIKQAINAGKHVLAETPMVLKGDCARECFELAEQKGVILMEANKTAHCPAFNHLMVMIKSGVIGEVVDIEASLSKLLADKSLREFDPEQAGGSLEAGVQWRLPSPVRWDKPIRSLPARPRYPADHGRGRSGPARKRKNGRTYGPVPVC